MKGNKKIIFSLFGLILNFALSSCSSSDDLLEIQSIEWQSPDSIFNPQSGYIVVIGDIQEYTVSNELFYFFQQTSYWLHSQQKYFNCISCVLQNGDLTWNNNSAQWDLADLAFGYMGDSLLVIPSTGNHDYTWKGSIINDRNSSRLNSLRNLQVLRNKTFEQFEKNRLDNIIVPIKVNKDSIYIISLEFGPRKETVTWADSIVRTNPDKKYILMTHEWLTRDGDRIDQGSFADLQMPNISHSTPQEIWEKMVYPNDNILCVLCGHNGFCKYLYSPNQKGREVCQILFNLQYQENGGDGMIQIWEFPSNKNTINISVYNTIKREYHTDPETRMSIQL